MIERGMSENVTQTVLSSYKDGGGRKTHGGPFREFAEHVNRSPATGLQPWPSLIAECATSLISKGKWNRAMTVINSAKIISEIAFGRSITDRALEKLRLTAEIKQKRSVTSTGKRISATIRMRKVHEHIIAEIARLGPRWRSTIDIAVNRQWASFGFRALIAGRPEDPEKFLDGIEEFSNSGWSDSDDVTVRLLDTKDSTDQKMSSHKRRPPERAVGGLGAAIKICKPIGTKELPLPPYFDIIGNYKKRRGTRDGAIMTAVNLPSQGSMLQLALHPFFMCEGKQKRLQPLKRSSISSETLRLLIAAGGILPGPPLKAEHVRHSTVSQAYYIAPERLSEIARRARHSTDTLLTTYDTAIDDEQLQHLEHLNPSDQLERLLLG